MEQKPQEIVVGKCKLCGGDVIAKEKIFVCSNAENKKETDEQSGEERWVNTGCQFKIFRGALKKLGKPELKNEEVEKLLNGETIVFDLVSKSGSSYQKDGYLDNPGSDGIAWIKINFGNN